MHDVSHPAWLVLAVAVILFLQSGFGLARWVDGKVNLYPFAFFGGTGLFLLAFRL